ncbi:uncharacterized protein BN675_01734 [Parabacteroides merdae CAG:48]|nr:uncharacterized protein BN675_01734 [Parabacteroides merdae CAG:48]
MPFVVVADIEGDDADRIAGDQVTVVRFVVESESEDPAQLFHASHAVFAVEGEDDLAVASGLEFVFVFQLSAEFAMVIYLAVDGADQFAVFASQRLSAGCRIDDGEAFMGEDGGFSLIDAAPVRAAVTDTFTHFQGLLTKVGGAAMDVEDCCNTTHGNYDL